MIICTAIKLKMNNLAGTEQIICGLRHGDCLQVFNQLNSKIITKKILLPPHAANVGIAQAAGDRGWRQLSTIPVDNHVY